MSLEKDFVPYQESMEVKELGFNEPCFGRYYYKESYPMLNPHSEETEVVFEFGQYIKQTEVTIVAPTFSQAFRWFREKYNLDSMVQPTYSTKYQFRLFHIEIKTKVQIYGKYMEKEFDTFEEAELACLKKLIEIVKQEK